TVTLTATLSPATLGETISVRGDTTGTTIPGNPTTNSSGVTSLTFNPAFSGTHTLEAVYPGNPAKSLQPSFKTGTLAVSGNCLTSQGANLCIGVPSATNPNTISSFVVNPSSVSTGDTVTLTATLSPATLG